MVVMDTADAANQRIGVPRIFILLQVFLATLIHGIPVTPLPATRRVYHSQARYFPEEMRRKWRYEVQHEKVWDGLSGDGPTEVWDSAVATIESSITVPHVPSSSTSLPKASPLPEDVVGAVNSVLSVDIDTEFTEPTHRTLHRSSVEFEGPSSLLNTLLFRPSFSSLTPIIHTLPVSTAGILESSSSDPIDQWEEFFETSSAKYSRKAISSDTMVVIVTEIRATYIYNTRWSPDVPGTPLASSLGLSVITRTSISSGATPVGSFIQHSPGDRGAIDTVHVTDLSMSRFSSSSTFLYRNHTENFTSVLSFTSALSKTAIFTSDASTSLKFLDSKILSGTAFLNSTFESYWTNKPSDKTIQFVSDVHGTMSPSPHSSFLTTSVREDVTPFYVVSSYEPELFYSSILSRFYQTFSSEETPSVMWTLSDKMTKMESTFNFRQSSIRESPVPDYFDITSSITKQPDIISFLSSSFKAESTGEYSEIDSSNVFSVFDYFTIITKSYSSTSTVRGTYSTYAPEAYSYNDAASKSVSNIVTDANVFSDTQNLLKSSFLSASELSPSLPGYQYSLPTSIVVQYVTDVSEMESDFDSASHQTLSHFDKGDYEELGSSDSLRYDGSIPLDLSPSSSEMLMPVSNKPEYSLWSPLYTNRSSSESMTTSTTGFNPDIVLSSQDGNLETFHLSPFSESSVSRLSEESRKIGTSPDFTIYDVLLTTHHVQARSLASDTESSTFSDDAEHIESFESITAMKSSEEYFPGLEESTDIFFRNGKSSFAVYPLDATPSEVSFSFTLFSTNTTSPQETTTSYRTALDEKTKILHSLKSSPVFCTVNISANISFNDKISRTDEICSENFITSSTEALTSLQMSTLVFSYTSSNDDDKLFTLSSKTLSTTPESQVSSLSRRDMLLSSSESGEIHEESPSHMLSIGEISPAESTLLTFISEFSSHSFDLGWYNQNDSSFIKTLLSKSDGKFIATQTIRLPVDTILQASVPLTSEFSYSVPLTSPFTMFPTEISSSGSAYYTNDSESRTTLTVIPDIKDRSSASAEGAYSKISATTVSSSFPVISSELKHPKTVSFPLTELPTIVTDTFQTLLTTSLLTMSSNFEHDSSLRVLQPSLFISTSVESDTKLESLKTDSHVGLESVLTTTGWHVTNAMHSFVETTPKFVTLSKTTKSVHSFEVMSGSSKLVPNDKKFQASASSKYPEALKNVTIHISMGTVIYSDTTSEITVKGQSTAHETPATVITHDFSRSIPQTSIDTVLYPSVTRSSSPGIFKTSFKGTSFHPESSETRSSVSSASISPSPSNTSVSGITTPKAFSVTSKISVETLTSTDGILSHTSYVSHLDSGFVKSSFEVSSLVHTISSKTPTLGDTASTNATTSNVRLLSATTHDSHSDVRTSLTSVTEKVRPSTLSVIDGSDTFSRKLHPSQLSSMSKYSKSDSMTPSPTLLKSEVQLTKSFSPPHTSPFDVHLTSASVSTGSTFPLPLPTPRTEVIQTRILTHRESTYRDEKTSDIMHSDVITGVSTMEEEDTSSTQDTLTGPTRDTFLLKDRNFWILTVLETPFQKELPDNFSHTMELRLANAYSLAFSKFRVQRDLSKEEDPPVYVLILSITNNVVQGTIELVYIVERGGVLVPAAEAAAAFNHLRHEQLRQYLGYDTIVKATPYHPLESTIGIVQPTVPISAIVGGILGSLLILLCCLWLYCRCCRPTASSRRSSQRSLSSYGKHNRQQIFQEESHHITITEELVKGSTSEGSSESKPQTDAEQPHRPLPQVPLKISEESPEGPEQQRSESPAVKEADVDHHRGKTKEGPRQDSYALPDIESPRRKRSRKPLSPDDAEKAALNADIQGAPSDLFHYVPTSPPRFPKKPEVTSQHSVDSTAQNQEGSSPVESRCGTGDSEGSEAALLPVDADRMVEDTRSDTDTDVAETQLHLARMRRRISELLDDAFAVAGGRHIYGSLRSKRIGPTPEPFHRFTSFRSAGKRRARSAAGNYQMTESLSFLDKINRPQSAEGHRPLGVNIEESSSRVPKSVWSLASDGHQLSENLSASDSLQDPQNEDKPASSPSCRFMLRTSRSQFGPSSSMPMLDTLHEHPSSPAATQSVRNAASELYLAHSSHMNPAARDEYDEIDVISAVRDGEPVAAIIQAIKDELQKFNSSLPGTNQNESFA